jgi:hypothetical protein
LHDDDVDTRNYTEGKVYVDITVRVASAPQAQKAFTMQIMDENEKGEIEYFRTAGEGYQTFADVTWNRVPIDSLHDVHTLVIVFADGNINLCSVKVERHDDQTTRNFAPRMKELTPRDEIVPPMTWSAFEYDYAYDTSPDSYQGNCHDYDKDDGVDGVYTSVSIEYNSNRNLRSLSKQRLKVWF